MSESELTTQILKDIRSEIRGLREDQRALADHQRAFAEQVMQRFEIIETTLRDLAQQLVILARGVKTAMEAAPRGG
jgi:hypothetical protein